MRCEVVAIGTELLLGQVVDTNSAWIGARLARAGIDVHHRTTVGDNVGRIAAALGVALGRSDAVLACGGLGPTPDDVTREALAQVLGVPLVPDAAALARARDRFAHRGQPMPPGNARQAEVPAGATVIPQTLGTAPGLICPVGAKVVYAVPGVPHEMADMVERGVLPDLASRSPAPATMESRMVRTWGRSESAVAEVVAPRLAALDAVPGAPTLAFLADARGVAVRITAKAATTAAATALLDAEEESLRRLLGADVFGVDDQTLAQVVGERLAGQGRTLGVAESLTGGLVGAHLTTVAGASGWFLGSIVAYGPGVKAAVLGVPVGPVVGADAAAAMAGGARRLLGSDVGLALTGVAGPASQEGQPVGTVWVGVDLGGEVTTHHAVLHGDRARVRELAALTGLDLLRRRLLSDRPGRGAGRRS
ncbi:MAG: competence/damage-inducible protein A [Acidimicrobiales bacterium]